MRPKTKSSFKTYIKKLEGKDLLPNGFYVGERIYYICNGSKYYGTITDTPPKNNPYTSDVLKAYKKSEIVWCHFDDGEHWFNMVKETLRAT